MLVAGTRRTYAIIAAGKALVCRWPTIFGSPANDVMASAGGEMQQPDRRVRADCHAARVALAQDKPEETLSAVVAVSAKIQPERAQRGDARRAAPRQPAR